MIESHDAVLEEVGRWQARPLDALYALVYFDALWFIAADGELPDTDIGPESELPLSLAFNVSDSYGTRSGAVVLISSDGIVTVEDRSHEADGGVSNRVRMAFQFCGRDS